VAVGRFSTLLASCWAPRWRGAQGPRSQCALFVGLDHSVSKSKEGSTLNTPGLWQAACESSRCPSWLRVVRGGVLLLLRFLVGGVLLLPDFGFCYSRWLRVWCMLWICGRVGPSYSWGRRRPVPERRPTLPGIASCVLPGLRRPGCSPDSPPSTLRPSCVRRSLVWVSPFSDSCNLWLRC